MPSTIDPNTSVSSFARTHSVRSGPASPLHIKVVTSPPWARDEPPSPKDDEDQFLTVPSEDNLKRRRSESRPSDAASFNSEAAGPSRWWIFTRPRLSSLMNSADNEAMSEIKHDLKGNTLRERSKSWMMPHSFEESRHLNRPSNDTTGQANEPWGLRISLPTPSPALFTTSHTQTPGWDSPWTPRPPPRSRNQYSQMDMDTFHEEPKDDSDTSPSARKKLKKKIRGYLLMNSYVPLLFRFINIAFTTAALAIAIRIRIIEKRNAVMGALGSSPTLTIIFAPLTMTHVMIAVYLEYFGKPLGLWHTSAKLAHTLSETLFICAWSACLSLCFDNYFTSVIPCTAGGTSWYSQLKPPPVIPNSGRHEGGIGDVLCDYQVALISLVTVGLIMYCFNLIISLYRIFEKVKYHPANASLRGA